MRGSVTNVIAPDGTLITEYSYDEFGNKTQNGDAGFLNEVTFTGSVSDTSTGLQYLNARYYNPETGRFLTQDSYTGNPYDPWTQNLYAYCGNNPVNFVDPTGHFFNLIAGAIGAAVGAVVGVAINGVANLVEGKDFFENVGAAAVSGALVGAAAGVTCGASLIATGTGMLAVTGVTGAGAIVTAAGAYGLSSMAGSTVRQVITTGSVDPVQVTLDGINGGIMGGGLQYASNVFTGPHLKLNPTPKTSTSTQGKQPVIGKTPDLNKQGSIKPNQYKVADLLPDKGSPKLNWKQNSGVLRGIMNDGKPIADISSQSNNTGFLYAERYLLGYHGWTFKNGLWFPPSK